MLTWTCLFAAAVQADIIQDLKDLEKEVSPRFFWVSLRSNCGTAEMETFFQKELKLEIFHFKD